MFGCFDGVGESDEGWDGVEVEVRSRKIVTLICRDLGRAVDIEEDV